MNFKDRKSHLTYLSRSNSLSSKALLVKHTGMWMYRDMGQKADK